ncbi:MAG: ATP synthase F1 subunit epsilon [Solirubrobacteraceae bacterium]|nr:ATP synthase F1 subunit epsilon [Solirubrobacteraceae bacterium]
MAHQPYNLEILTPEGQVFSGEVEFISTRTETGSIGIYARHQPLLALLTPSELRVTKEGGEIVRFAQGEGYVQISPERVLLLVEEAVDPKDLSAEELEQRLADAQARAEAAAEGSEEAKRAERDQLRATAFLEVVRGAAA